MNSLSRRCALASFAAGLGGALVDCGASPNEAASALRSPGDPTMTFSKSLAGTHSIIPLPFSASGLQGISEKLIVSHHDNNYAAAVKNLNRVEQELSDTSTGSPPFVVAALRERELTFRNSKALHEAYFENLGGDGKRTGAIESALADAYGSTARWEEHFRATALGLGGGSGWVVLALELDTGTLRTVAMTGHAQALAAAAPLLVLDMYEHSYQIDFGAAVARYIDAVATNTNWDIVNRRLERALRAAAALRA